jgi:hypothetical protein
MCVVIIVQNRHCWTITLWVLIQLFIISKRPVYKIRFETPPGERFERLVIGLWFFVEFYFLTIYTYPIYCEKYCSYRNTMKNATEIWVSGSSVHSLLICIYFISNHQKFEWGPLLILQPVSELIFFRAQTVTIITAA